MLFVLFCLFVLQLSYYVLSCKFVVFGYWQYVLHKLRICYKSSTKHCRKEDGVLRVMEVEFVSFLIFALCSDI